MGLDNDTRGWIMTCISGVAFLCTLFHVTAVEKLSGTWRDSASTASFILIALFLGGVIGIQILSRVLHHFIPSHVVDCDHTHDEEEVQDSGDEIAKHNQDHDHGRKSSLPVITLPHENLDEDDEDTPLLSRTTSISPPKLRQSSAPEHTSNRLYTENGSITTPTPQRPSIMPRTFTQKLSKYVGGKKDNCDETGPCMGFSDPCGQNCFRVMKKRGSILPKHSQSLSRVATWKFGIDHTEVNDVNGSPNVSNYKSVSNVRSNSPGHNHHHAANDNSEPTKSIRRTSTQSHGAGGEHHHHVPTNAFMSIGLQTSIAIALHKAPEGFITYATNHANPTLGFTVFMALFIHNITEGFAMSLPLYLALGSRFKAIIWSSLLGGISQPIGAGIAALWFRLAQGTEQGAPSEAVYGGMFAITSGVMTTVALSLFSESLQLSHNKSTCILFAFLGMGILGISFALTAK